MLVPKCRLLVQNVPSNAIYTWGLMMN